MTVRFFVDLSNELRLEGESDFVFTGRGWNLLFELLGQSQWKVDLLTGLKLSLASIDHSGFVRRNKEVFLISVSIFSPL